jgi:hypothetical protein
MVAIIMPIELKNPKMTAATYRNIKKTSSKNQISEILYTIFHPLGSHRTCYCSATEFIIKPIAHYYFIDYHEKFKNTILLALP